MQFIRQINNLIISCVFFLIFFLSDLCFAQPVDDSWDVVRQQFSLNHHLERPEVKNQIHWLLAHPNYLKKLKEAEPFIYHIINEVQKRHLPGEIVLIPMLESAYNPLAYSGAGAAGLWQLMPKTGKHLGIKGDWWIDGRRHIGASTSAALNYFSYLGRFFHGDWLLAIAAYDCGEGKIQRLVRATPYNRRSFWYLALPTETQIYVPRLLALAEIIAHPNQYHVQLPRVPHQPYFTEVHINRQMDLNQAAKLAGMSFKDFLKLNPGFNHWSTSPNIPSKLLIPMSHIQEFSRNFSNYSTTPASLEKHIVQPGESLYSIALKFHTTPNLLAKINHLQSINLQPGQFIHIPTTMASTKPQYMPVKHQAPVNHSAIIAPKFYKILHIVQPHEQMINIQRQYQISQQDIISWNQLSNRQLIPGQKLIIWRQTNGNPYYIVRPGDTLIQIAKNNHLSTDNIKRLNPGLNSKRLHPGDKIRVV